MTVARLLAGKGGNVISVAPNAGVAEIAELLCEKRIGAVLVMEGGAIRGVLSERDIVRCLHERGANVLTCSAEDIMTRDVVTTIPDESVMHAMGQMTRRRIRHLPVLADGELIGIVSIGDLVKARIEEVEREAASLKDYIQHA